MYNFFEKLLYWNKKILYLQSYNTVPVVQLVERQIVVLVVEGSSPFGHPNEAKSLKIACQIDSDGLFLWRR